MPPLPIHSPMKNHISTSVVTSPFLKASYNKNNKKTVNYFNDSDPEVENKL